MSLKRSGKAQLPDDVTRPKHIEHAGDALHLRHSRRLHGAVPRLPRRGRTAHRTTTASSSCCRSSRISVRRSSRRSVSRRRSTASAPSSATPSASSVRSRRCRSPTRRRTRPRVSSEEPGRAQLVSEDSGDEVGRRRRRRRRRRANQAHLTARHVAFLDHRPALLRAGALQGRARLVQPESDAGRDRWRCLPIRAGISCSSLPKSWPSTRSRRCGCGRRSRCRC